MWEPVLAVGIAFALPAALSRHFTARPSARALRELRPEIKSLANEIRRTSGLGDFEARFEGSKEQLRPIAGSLPAMIVRSDLERRDAFADRPAEEWYGLPAARVDREQLRRAVTNVVDSACQAMTQASPAGGVGEGTAPR